MEWVQPTITHNGQRMCAGMSQADHCLNTLVVCLCIVAHHFQSCFTLCCSLVCLQQHPHMSSPIAWLSAAAVC